MLIIIDYHGEVNKKKKQRDGLLFFVFNWRNFMFYVGKQLNKRGKA